MSSEPLVSIIITTCNRARHLRETLESVGQLEIPPSLSVELIVVDNASTDDTAAVVKSFSLSNLDLRYCFEGKKGQSNARNTGMAQARGEIFLWTDDDMRLPRDWIAQMCEPILSGNAECVAGKIRLASYLERDWMSRSHYDRLADTRYMGEDFGAMIGANMGFHRKVLERVPAFDPELGPGALGFADDSLFSYQMWEAGFKIVALPVEVEHHVDPSRLLRKSWLKHGEASGKSKAYLQYHWEHEPLKIPRVQALVWQLALIGFRLLRRPSSQESEGCDRREVRMVQNLFLAKQFLAESRKTRKYARRGLTKLTA